MTAEPKFSMDTECPNFIPSMLMKPRRANALAAAAMTNAQKGENTNRKLLIQSRHNSQNPTKSPEGLFSELVPTPDYWLQFR